MADATGKPIPQVQRLNYNGEELGMGFNSDTGLAVGTALDFQLPSQDLSQEVESDVSIVTSHEELVSKMHLSVQLEGHYSMFSAGGKTDFLNATSYNSSSTFVMAKMLISNTVTRGKEFKLKQNAEAVLHSGDSNFKQAFGDSFVRAVYKGGEFYTVLRITSVDAKTESQLAVSAHAALQAGIGGGSFQLDLNKANSQENTRSDFSVSYYQKGGLGENEIGTTLSIEEIQKRLHSFPDAVKAHAYPYFIEVATYDTLPLPVDTKLQQQAFLEALQDADAQKLKFLQSRNDCTFAAEHPEFFIDPPAQAILRGYADIFTQLVNAVTQHAIAIARGETPLLFDASKLTPPIVVPVVKLQKRDSGVSSAFIDLWVNKDKPDTTRNDSLLIKSIGLQAVSSLPGFYQIKDPSGNPDATLRLQAQALTKVLGTFRDYSYANLVDPTSGPGHLLDSLAQLPNLLPLSISSLAFCFNQIRDTRGLDQFQALTKLDMTWNALESIRELGSLPLLKQLTLTANRVSDLTPLSSCTQLESLDISGNKITDLTPLASCKSLKALNLIGSIAVLNNQVADTANPLVNILPLASIPALANPFTVGTKLSVRVGKLSEGNDKQYRGTATRIGTSHQFQVHLTRGSEVLDEIWTLSIICPLAPPFNPLGILSLIVQPGELPPAAILLNILRNVQLKSEINLAFANLEDPKNAVVDLEKNPGLVKFPMTTIDASVVS